MKNQRFYQKSDNSYIALTGETPKQFKGQLFVAFAGDSLDLVQESLLSKEKLDCFSEVDAEDIPIDWQEAFKKHGFEFEEPTEEPVKEPVSSLAKNIKELQLQIEFEILKKQLEEIKSVPEPSSNPTTSTKMESWAIFNITIAVFIFASIILLLII